MNKEEIKTKALRILVNHIGEANAISMPELYKAVFEKEYTNKISDTRPIRYVIRSLRAEGLPICSTMSGTGGYYLASAGSELQEFVRRMEKRAIRSLAIICKIKKISLPDYLGQLRLAIQGDTDENCS